MSTLLVTSMSSSTDAAWAMPACRACRGGSGGSCRRRCRAPAAGEPQASCSVLSDAVVMDALFPGCQGLPGGRAAQARKVNGLSVRRSTELLRHDTPRR